MDETRQKEKVEKILEVCNVSKEEAIDSLAACNDDLELAVERLLAGKEHSWQKVSKRSRSFKSFTSTRLNDLRSAPNKDTTSKETNRRTNKAELYYPKHKEKIIDCSDIVNNKIIMDKATDQQVQLKEGFHDESLPSFIQFRDKRTRTRKGSLEQKLNLVHDKNGDLEAKFVNRDSNAMRRSDGHLSSIPQNGNYPVSNANMKAESNRRKRGNENRYTSTMSRQVTVTSSMENKASFHPTTLSHNHLTWKSSNGKEVGNSTQELESSADSNCRELRIRFGSLTLSSSLRSINNRNENDKRPMEAFQVQCKELEETTRAVDVSSRNFHVDSWDGVKGDKLDNDLFNSLDNNLKHNQTEKPYGIPTNSDIPIMRHEQELYKGALGTVHHESPMISHLTKDTLGSGNVSHNEMIRHPSFWSYLASNHSSTARNPLQVSDEIPISLLPPNRNQFLSFQTRNHPVATTVSRQPTLGFQIDSSLKQNDRSTAFDIPTNSTVLSQENSYPIENDLLRSLWKEERNNRNQRHISKQSQNEGLSSFHLLDHQLSTEHHLKRQWK